MCVTPPDSVGPGARVVRSARVPMGGWAEEGRGGRDPDTVPEEGSEDDMPPNIHKVFTKSHTHRSCVCVWGSISLFPSLLR